MAELIGRSADIAAVTNMLVRENKRIVTLWGPGGIGKTSVARAVVGSRAFDGDTFFCSLAGARGLADVCVAVGDALALTMSSVRSAREGVARVGRALAARGRVLVVLDNVEHLVPEVAELLDTWTTAAPDARVLVTSRAVLAIPLETPYELLPLASSAPAGEVPPAVALLALRARALVPEFEADVPLLTRIVQRLDGIPLAIELAAAKLVVLTPAELLRELHQRFDVLRREYGGADPRQQRLYDTIDWSWALLDESERRAIAELSVTRGGFDLEAARAILSEGARAADLVLALRNKSFLARMPSSRPRFTMLESIRDFAASKLDSFDATCERHARHYADTASALVSRTRADRSLDTAAFATLSTESDNLLAVVERYASTDDPERARRALAVLRALEPVLTTRGESERLVDLVTRAVERAAKLGVQAGELAPALYCSGVVLTDLGRLAEATKTLEDALDATAGGVERVRVLNALGLAAEAADQLERARQVCERALGDARRIGARAEEGVCLANLGVVHHAADAFDTAREHYERALPILESERLVRAEIRTRARLGFLKHDLDDLAGAIREYSRAHELEQEHRFALAPGIVVGYMGNVRRAQGRTEEALAHYDEALASLRLAGDRRFEAVFSMDRAIALVLAGRHEEALRDLRATEAIASEVGDTGLVRLGLGYAIVCHAALGDIEAAVAAENKARATPSGQAFADELLDVHHAHILLARAETERERAHAVAYARELELRLGSAPTGQHRRLALECMQRVLHRVEPPPGAFVLQGGQRARLPDGSWIDLQPRAARVLELLAARRRQEPGQVVTAAELISVAWPGERIAQAAALNRLRVLLSELRAQGLRDVLVSTKGGYLIDAAITALVLD